MAIVSLAAYILVSAYKAFLLFFKADVALFAIANSIDYFLIAVALFIIYKKLGGQKVSFSSEVGKRMFKKSKHYIVSSLMVTIFAQTDKIMLKLMINEEAVGYYSAAVKCAAITGFVFTAIIDSFRPIIFQKKKDGDEVGYEKNIERLYCVVIYLALAQSIAMTFLAKYIIWILYGNDYSNSVLALQIIVWYTTFSYIGGIRNIWILGEDGTEKRVSFDEQFDIDNPSTFLFKVRGDSMVDAGIFEDDTVIIKKTNHAKNGDIVLAFIDGGYTLKYYKNNGNDVWLQPANKNYPIIRPKEILEIFGVVKGVVRKI